MNIIAYTLKKGDDYVAKGIFIGFIDKKGLIYDSNNLPSEIQRKLIEVFISTAYRKQQLQSYNINLRQELINKTD